jgi:hypothetical protein
MLAAGVRKGDGSEFGLLLLVKSSGASNDLYIKLNNNIKIEIKKING